MADTTMETSDMESVPLTLDAESHEEEKEKTATRTPEPPMEAEPEPETPEPEKEPVEETKADVTARMDMDEEDEVKPDIENIKEENAMQDDEVEDEKPVKQRREKKPKKVVISVIVKAQDHSEFIFKVTPQTEMERIMDSYSQRTEKPRNLLRFFLDGKRVRSEDTPESLGMENEDSIDVTEETLGGAF